MLLFRWTIFMLLAGAAVSLVFYLGTGRLRYRRWALLALKWALIAAFGFFAVLVLERIV